MDLKQSTTVVPAVDRAIELLQAIARAGKPLTLSETDTELARRYTGYGFPTRTQNSINNFDALQENLRFVREHGYAYDHEEFSIGVNCVAAPIFDHTGEVIAAMSVGVPNHRMTANRMTELTQLLLHYASQLSRTLGWIEGKGVPMYSTNHHEASAR